MPRPHKGEGRSEFISRAIREFRHEGIPQVEAVGRAHGYWKYYSKRRKKRT